MDVNFSSTPYLIMNTKKKAYHPMDENVTVSQIRYIDSIFSITDPMVKLCWLSDLTNNSVNKTVFTLVKRKILLLYF